MKYTIEIGDTVDEIEATTTEEAVRIAFEAVLNRDQFATLEIEGNVWSEAEWDAAVTDEEGKPNTFLSRGTRTPDCPPDIIFSGDWLMQPYVLIESKLLSTIQGIKR